MEPPAKKAHRHSLLCNFHENANSYMKRLAFELYSLMVGKVQSKFRNPLGNTNGITELGLEWCTYTTPTVSVQYPKNEKNHLEKYYKTQTGPFTREICFRILPLAGEGLTCTSKATCTILAIPRQASACLLISHVPSWHTATRLWVPKGCERHSRLVPNETICTKGNPAKLRRKYLRL